MTGKTLVPLVAAVVLALGVSEVQAATVSTQRTREVTKTGVVATLASALAPGNTPAPHRIYDCHPGRCAFWVRGTSECTGVANVREGATEYRLWFSQFRCQPS